MPSAVRHAGALVSSRRMGLLKTRPKVEVRVPAEIIPGDHFEALVVLDCERAVEVDYVDVLLVGRERWAVSNGNTASGQRRVICRLGARLSEATELPEGRTTLRVTMPLPPDCPPSFRGKTSHIVYELSVHASVPWWPDRRAAFEIHVAPPPRESPASEPRVYSSDPGGPHGDEKHGELSLATDWTRAGDVVTGAFALSNTEAQRYEAVEVGLVATEHLYLAGGGLHASRETIRYQLTLPPGPEGDMTPFSFRLPKQAPPDLPYAPRRLVTVDWRFELRARAGWGQALVLRVPFAVLPRSPAPSDAPPRVAPPQIGSDRLGRLWAEVGAPLGLTHDLGQLVGRFGETELVVRRDHLGRDGIHLAIALRYPELHLALEVAPASAVQQMLGGGAQIGVEGWDRAHYVHARDEGQVAEVLRALVPRLERATLRRMNDTELLIHLRDNGQTQARLRQVCEAAVALARTFEALRTDLPPPTAIAETRPEWERLAAQLGARLETARMRIEGRVGALAAEAFVSFDDRGAPARTWLTITPSSPLDEDSRFGLDADEPDPKGAIAARFEGEAVALVEALAHGAREVRLTPERAAICLPSPLGLEASGRAIQIGPTAPPRAFDAARAEQRLGHLARLCLLLRGQSGPYR